ncbi:MAG: hypothetical protein PHE83_17355 [Opitutaceae bacterium]|nr:hypothetical protein [Opitutaceae bacterium]
MAALAGITGNVRWLLEGDLQEIDLKYKGVGSRGAVAVMADLSQAGCDPATGTFLSIDRVCAASQLILAILALLPSADYIWLVQRDDQMAPTIEQGDIVIACRRDQLSEAGLYVFKGKRGLTAPGSSSRPLNICGTASR